MNEAAKQSISKKMKGNKNRIGSHHNLYVKECIRIGNKGYHWYTDGTTEVKAKACPAGFKPGRLPIEKEWFHIEEKEYLVPKGTTPPVNAVKGRYFSTKGYHWHSTAVKNFLMKDEDIERRRPKTWTLYDGMKPRHDKTGWVYPGDPRY